MSSEQPTGEAPYRAQHRPHRARRLRYDALRPVTRARLAAAAHGQGAWCLWGEAGAPVAETAQWLLIATLVLGSAGLLAVGSGRIAAIDLQNPQEQSMRLAAAALLVEAAGLLVGLEVWAARKAAGRPLERRVYLLARELVDARGHDLVLHDTEGLAGVHARDGRLVLTFRDGARFSVRAGGLDPDALRQRLDERRAEALRAEADGDEEQAARLDPLAAERADGVLSGSSGCHRLTRLARLALGGAAASAAMLLGALTVGRAVAIERAVRHEQEGPLLWFAQTDRWMSGWAARRWADLALRPGHGPAQERYLLLGPDPRGFARRLEAQTADCSALDRHDCAATVRALCESRFHDPAALRRAVTRLDIATTRALGPRCQGAFDRQGWTHQDLAAQQVSRATADRDLDVLWAFPAREAIERLYDEGRAALETRRDTPTRRALGAALAHLRERDVDLVVGVTLSQARSVDELTLGTQALMHHLGRQPFGPLLRLAARARPRAEPHEIVLPDPAPDEAVAGLGPGSLGWPSRRFDHVWAEARLDAHLTVRTGSRREPEVTAVRWVLSTRERPAVRARQDPPWDRRPDEPTWQPPDSGPDRPWTTSTFEAPLDPPVRWSDATSLDAGGAGLVDRLL